MKLFSTILLALLSIVAVAQNSPSDRIFYGGGAGFSFSSYQTNVSLYPIIGYKLTPKFSAGVGLTYQYVRTEVQPGRKETLNNYGWSVFSRYRLIKQIYAQAEYERLTFEYFTDRTYETTERRGYDSFLLGASFVETVGGRSSFFVTALYNVLYSEDDEFRPYSSPWVIRAGIGVGF